MRERLEHIHAGVSQVNQLLGEAANGWKIQEWQETPWKGETYKNKIESLGTWCGGLVGSGTPHADYSTFAVVERRGLNRILRELW